MCFNSVKFRVIFAMVLCFFIGAGCSSTEKENDKSGSKSFSKTQKVFKDKNYEMALTRLLEFRAKYPFSDKKDQVDLMIADANFGMGEYEEAAMDYKEFISLHPQNAKVEYAVYKVGECYWKSAPEEIDRESDFTKLALMEWNKFLNDYPNSKYVPDVKTKIEEGNRRLAGKLHFIANFYCRQKLYHSCALRAEKLMQTYQKYPDINKKALKLASKSFGILAKQKQKDPKNVSNILLRDMTTEQLQARANRYATLLGQSN